MDVCLCLDYGGVGGLGQCLGGWGGVMSGCASDSGFFV